MAKRYVFVRMPLDVYNLYMGVKKNMELDICKLTGKEAKLTMPKVFRAVVSKDINENYIQISKNNLINMIKRGKK